MADRACPPMVTLIGDAGVGKTRLTEEFLDSIGDRVRVVRGRCLPYGEGITFWPIVGVVGDAAGIEETDNPEAAREKLRQLVGDNEVADRVAAAVGLLDAPFQVAELFWGIRRFFEILAKDRPLAILFERHTLGGTDLPGPDRAPDRRDRGCAGDAPLHGAPGTSRQATVLGGEGPVPAAVVLTGLSDADAARLIENMLGRAGLSAHARARVVAAAEGNPLFVEQLVSMLIDTGIASLRRWSLGADRRLERDRHPADDSCAVGSARSTSFPTMSAQSSSPASVIGLVFVQASLQAIVDDDVRSQVPAHLTTLEQRQLVRRQTDEEALEYRFAHLMIRDATYARTPQANARASSRALRRLGGRSQSRGRSRDRVRGNPRLPSRTGPSLLVRARPPRRAWRSASVSTPRAVWHRPVGAPSCGVTCQPRPTCCGARRLCCPVATLRGHGSSLRSAWRSGRPGTTGAAAATLEAAIAGAAALHDTGLETTARLTLLMRRYYADPSKVEGRVEDRVREGIRVLEREGRRGGLARAWLAMAGLRMGDQAVGCGRQGDREGDRARSTGRKPHPRDPRCAEPRKVRRVRTNACRRGNDTHVP